MRFAPVQADLGGLDACVSVSPPTCSRAFVIRLLHSDVSSGSVRLVLWRFILVWLIASAGESDSDLWMRCYRHVTCG